MRPASRMVHDCVEGTEVIRSSISSQANVDMSAWQILKMRRCRVLRLREILSEHGRSWYAKP